MTDLERTCAAVLAEDGRRRSGVAPLAEFDVPLAMLYDLADVLPEGFVVPPDAAAGAVVLAHLAGGGTVVMR